MSKLAYNGIALYYVHTKVLCIRLSYFCYLCSQVVQLSFVSNKGCLFGCKVPLP